MPPTTAEYTYHYDEIDLRDLFRTLWRSKRLIIVSTVILTLAAIAYTRLAPSAYEARAQTSPADADSLASYNLQNNIPKVLGTAPAMGSPTPPPATATAPGLTPDAAYSVFVQQLKSAVLKQQFFEAIYLPSHPGLSDAAISHLRSALDQNLNIQTTISGTGGPGPTTLTFQGMHPAELAEWLNQYIDMAQKAADAQLVNQLKASTQARIDDIDAQIQMLRGIAATERHNDIFRLTAALKIAKAAGISELQNMGNTADAHNGPMLYLRGSDVLQAEINVLETRTSDDPYIPQLPGLLYVRDQLQKSNDLEPQPFSVASIDQPATAPSSPIRPRKRLIVAMGFALGLILGVAIVLSRKKIRPHQAT